MDYFAQNGHTVVPSASLIPHDPSLLFTVAGMVPFKPYFLGEEVPAFNRAVSIQKCFRAADIDQIGTTQRHLTFFEMMGNFSFGDYFKEGAIQFAWGLITEGFGLDPERLWVTVHTSDDAAEELWRDMIGVRPERIQRLDADNFWDMGETGPCGPCSEIFFDKGPEFGADGGPALGGEDRFVEFWNLVFMQYEKGPGGSLTNCPSRTSTPARALTACSRSLTASSRCSPPTCSTRCSRRRLVRSTSPTARTRTPTSPSGASPTTVER